jgi:hypothetical protein
MTARGLLGVLLCAAAVSTALPGTASAKPGYSVFPERFSFEAMLPKSNGYKISLASFGHRWVEVALSRPGGEAALYFARGKANRHGVDVNLGRFGSVHARFTGHRVEGGSLFPGCRARPEIKERGRLKGSIRFRGEGDYAEVAVERVRAEYAHTFREVCNHDFAREGRRGRAPADRSEPIEVLEVEKKEKGQVVWLNVNESLTFDALSVSAGLQERFGRVIAVKLANATDGGGSFEVSPSRGQPQTVSLEPTRPFRGSGSYALQPDGDSTWTGDLRVPFPGLGQFPLTGPGFHATACRTHIFNHTLTCKHHLPSTRASGSIARLLGEADLR